MKKFSMKNENLPKVFANPRNVSNCPSCFFLIVFVLHANLGVVEVSQKESLTSGEAGTDP